MHGCLDRLKGNSVKFSAGQLLRLATLLEMGIRAGRDWISVLDWMSKTDADRDLRHQISRWICQLRFESTESFLRSEQRRSNDPLNNLFISIVIQNHRGISSGAALFRSYSQMAKTFIRLKRQEKAMLFLPKFQALVCLIMSLGFVIVLPKLAEKSFPSFLDLNRFDLYALGMSLMAIGIVLLFWLCHLPQKRLRPLLGTPFFLTFLAIQMEGGIDFVSAWRAGLEVISLPDDLKAKLSLRELRSESVSEFIRSLKPKLRRPWPEILVGMEWVRCSGQSLSVFLKESAESEIERIFQTWDEEVRKVTALALLPLGFLIFPASLFLLIGPQMLKLIEVL